MGWNYTQKNLINHITQQKTYLKLNQTTAPTGAKDFKMYIVYQVVLSAEDGDYPQADFQTEVAAYNYIVINRPLYDASQELYIKPISRGF